MKTNVLAIILSGAVATLAIGDAMAQTQNSRSTYFWKEVPTVTN